METRVQTVAAQATQAGEIKSGDCVLPKEVNLTDLGTEAETISQHLSASPLPPPTRPAALPMGGPFDP